MAKKEKQPPKDLTFEVLRAAMFDLCKKAGATHVIVAYDGSCDSGQVEDPQLYKVKGDPANQKSWKEIPMPEGTAAWFVDAGYARDPMTDQLTRIQAGTEELTLKEALRAYCYDVLDKHFPGDWVNNEGGYGQLEIELTIPPKVKLEAHQRIEPTEDFEINVETGEVKEIAA